MHSVDEVPGGLRRETCPSSGFWALAAEDHSTQMISEPLRFFAIGRVSEPLCKFQEVLLLPFFCLNAILD
jgi:hypothetical protein